MSYSRWSNSHWYTYWEVEGRGLIENRNTAKFAICDVITFRAGEIRKDMEGCLDKVAEIDSGGDLDELKTYMVRFMENVDATYPKYKRGQKGRT